MHRSTTERSSAFTLTWSLRTAEGRPPAEAPALTLAWEVTAHEALYLTDRLWDHGADRRPTADPRGVYTFVHNGVLRLVFAPAPRPPRVHLRQVYHPFSTRLGAGESRRREVEVPLPVVEYSALARNVHAEAVPALVSRVALVIGWRPARALTEEPPPAPFVTHGDVGFIVHTDDRIASALDVEPIAVRRRTDPIARYLFPGESP